MNIASLKDIPFEVLADTFNQAFSDYIVPLHLTEKDLMDKFTTENTSLEHSVGVFDQEKLVGFIFIGIENNIVYNGGTGVIPEYRGQKLTEKMYDYLLSHLKETQLKLHLLEVITENHKAIKVYETVGFITKRKVICFKGQVSNPNASSKVTVREISENEVTIFQNKWAFAPSYQNSLQAIERNKNAHTFLGAFIENKLLGYVVFSESNARVKQFFVEEAYRQKGLGHELFYSVQQIIGDKPISLTNIDDSHVESISFLKKIGLQETVQQYEMEFVAN